MPTIQDLNPVDRAFPDPDGGGSPSGEPPPPRSSRKRRELSRERVDDAVDRARLYRVVGDALPDAVVDELLAGARTEKEIAGPGGLLAELTKRLVERAMEVELTDHLGYEPHQEPAGGTGNIRNGSTPKTLITEHGPVGIRTPRDRDGSFEPQIVRKRQRRFEGFDEKILALYARGLSTRDIEAHLREIYGVSVGRDLISRVTDGVMDDVRAWATRPLEDVYPVVFLDCLVIKIREGGSVQRRACYLALGVTLDGDRDVLGMWFQETEGAKFWMQVLTDLKTRGVQDILIALCRRAERVPRGDRSDLPEDHGANVHRPSDSPQPQVRAAPRARTGRPRPQTDLHREGRRRRPRGARGLRREVGRAVPGHHPGLAERLGARHPVPRLPRARSAASSTRRTRSKRSTASCARRSKPKATSRTRTPPASSSISRCKTPSRNGPGRGTGRRRCSRSRSTSVTAFPTPQTNRHYLTPTNPPLLLTKNQPNRGRDGHCWPPPAQIPACASNALGSCLGFWRRSARAARGVGSGLGVAIAR